MGRKIARINGLDALKVLGTVGLSLLLLPYLTSCSATENPSDMPIPEATKNMNDAMQELSVLFPKYKPKLEYLRRGAFNGNPKRQIDNHYAIFQVDKTLDQLQEDPNSDPLLAALIATQQYNKEESQPDTSLQYQVPSIVTTEELRRVVQDHEKDTPLGAGAPSLDFSNPDLIRIAIKTPDAKLYLIVAEPTFNTISPGDYEAVNDQGTYTLNDSEMMAIDASKRMEPLINRPNP